MYIFTVNCSPIRLKCRSSSAAAAHARRFRSCCHGAAVGLVLAKSVSMLLCPSKTLQRCVLRSIANQNVSSLVFVLLLHLSRCYGAPSCTRSLPQLSAASSKHRKPPLAFRPRLRKAIWRQCSDVLVRALRVRRASHHLQFPEGQPRHYVR